MRSGYLALVLALVLLVVSAVVRGLPDEILAESNDNPHRVAFPVSRNR